MVNRNAYPQQSFFQCVLPRHCFQKVTVVFHLHLCALNEEHADVLQDKRDRPSLPDAAGEEGHGGLDAPHHSFCRHKGGRSYLSIPQGFQKFVTWKTTQEGWGWGSNTGYTATQQPPGSRGCLAAEDTVLSCVWSQQQSRFQGPASLWAVFSGLLALAAAAHKEPVVRAAPQQAVCV